ncbi:MAG TPA: hypothetical protein GXZ90_00705 [Clostridiales bacterium]|nr:hypothetical protein [Clostridiales bacterium]
MKNNRFYTLGLIIVILIMSITISCASSKDKETIETNEIVLVEATFIFEEKEDLVHIFECTSMEDMNKQIDEFIELGYVELDIIPEPIAILVKEL